MSHLVRLGRVHRAVGVVVHQLVDAADRLEAQQRVLVLAELLVYRAQIYERKHPSLSHSWDNPRPPCVLLRWSEVIGGQTQHRVTLY